MGLLIPLNDKASFKDAISFLLSDRNRLYQMGHEARKHCIKYFDAYKMTEKIANIYHSLYIST